MAASWMRFIICSVLILLDLSVICIQAPFEKQGYPAHGWLDEAMILKVCFKHLLALQNFMDNAALRHNSWLATSYLIGMANSFLSSDSGVLNRIFSGFKAV